MAERNVSIAVTGKIQSFVNAMDQAAASAEKTAGKVGSSFEKGTSKIGSLFHGLGSQLGAFGVPFTGLLDEVGKKFDEAGAKGSKFRDQMSAVGGVTLAATAVGLAGAAAESVHLAEKFDAATGQIAASAGISEAAAKKIGQAFLTTAGDTTFTATEMSGAYATVAGQLGQVQGKALNNAQALLVMKAAGDLAEGTNTDLASATKGLANVMTDFGLKAGGAVEASDILTNVAHGTGLEVGGVADAFDKLHGRLGQVTPGIVDTGALLESLASLGIRGGRGVTTMSTAMSTLLGGSKSVNDALAFLNVHLYDANGKFVGMNNVITQLSPVLGKMTDAQKLLTEKTLFGASAGEIMGQVIDQGTAKFEGYRQAVGKAGTAQDAAKAATDNFHGQIEKLKVTAEDLGIQFGEKLIPILQSLMGAVSDTISWFEKHKAAAIAVATVIGGVLAAAVAVFVYDKVTAFVQGVQRMVTGLLGLGSQAEATAAEVTTAGAEMDTAMGAEGAAGSLTGVGEAAAGATGGLDGAAGAMGGAGASATAALGPLALLAGAGVGIALAYEAIVGPGKKFQNINDGLATASIPQLVSKMQDEASTTKQLTDTIGNFGGHLTATSELHKQFLEVLDKSPQYANKVIQSIQATGQNTEWYRQKLQDNMDAHINAQYAAERYSLQLDIEKAKAEGNIGAVYGLSLQLNAIPKDVHTTVETDTQAAQQAVDQLHNSLQQITGQPWQAVVQVAAQFDNMQGVASDRNIKTNIVPVEW